MKHSTLKKIKILGRLAILITVIVLISCLIVKGITQGITHIQNSIEENRFENRYEIDTYQVSSGDTLWKIGRHFVHDEDDVRNWIFKVTKLNNLTDYIYVGQTIYIYR